MAIVHDLAECIVGDITPFCGVSLEEKHAREDVGFLYIFTLVMSTFQPPSYFEMNDFHIWSKELVMIPYSIWCVWIVNNRSAYRIVLVGG